MNKCKLDHKEALDVVAYNLSIRYADVSPLVVEMIVRNYLTVRSLVAVPEDPTADMISARFNIIGNGGKAEWNAMISSAPGPYNLQMLKDADKVEATGGDAERAEFRKDCTESSEAEHVS